MHHRPKHQHEPQLGMDRSYPYHGYSDIAISPEEANVDATASISIPLDDIVIVELGDQ